MQLLFAKTVQFMRGLSPDVTKSDTKPVAWHSHKIDYLLECCGIQRAIRSKQRIGQYRNTCGGAQVNSRFPLRKRRSRPVGRGRYLQIGDWRSGLA